MEWTTTINLGGFGDSSQMEWQTVRSWDSFTNFFDQAVHVDAVTYCESPDLLLELFERDGSDLQSMDVLVGNREEYRSSVSDVNVARRLAQLYREDKLTIRLKSRKVVHSKLYRVVKPEDEVTLIAGSANLSYNSWTNQTNSVVVFGSGESLDSAGTNRQN
jgi:phosphatidylserine/phosphatidylglycerophosphate/cardiolipin synthase-like enzyme